MISAEAGWMVSEWECRIDPDTNLCIKSRRVECPDESEVHLRRPGLQMAPIVDRRKSEMPSHIELSEPSNKCSGNKPNEYAPCSACP